MKRRSAALFIAAASVLLFLFGGCSAHSASGSADAARSTDQGTFKSMTAAGAEAKTAAKSQGNLTGTDSRKIVKSASLTIETLRYEQSTGKLEALVKSFGGYIENSSVQGTGLQSPGGKRTASYTARIPADRLDSFLDAASQVGSVTGKSV